MVHPVIVGLTRSLYFVARRISFSSELSSRYSLYEFLVVNYPCQRRFSCAASCLPELPLEISGRDSKAVESPLHSHHVLMSMVYFS
jgi:hypothetical protein